MKAYTFFLVLTCSILGSSSLWGVETWVGTNGKAATSQLGQADFTGDVRNRMSINPPAADNMGFPKGIVIDSTNGKVYVSDPFNHRVLRFTSMAALQNGAAAEMAFGQPNLTSGTPAADRGGLNDPSGIALDQFGNLWVADTGNHRVVAYENAATETSGAAADIFLGQPDEHTTTSGTAVNKFNTPTDVAVDSEANVWVADRNNNRVLMFARPTSEDGNADRVLGHSNFTSSGSGPTANSVNFPAGIAFDPDGSLWVAELGNNRVTRFEASPNISSIANGANAVQVLGQTDFGIGHISPGTSNSTFNQPHGVAVDPRGRLFVADTMNSRILHFRLAASKANGAPADGILGDTDFNDATVETTSASTIDRPEGIVCDGTSRLFAADTGNSRVLRYDAKNNSARVASLKRQIKKQKRKLRAAKKKKKRSKIRRVKKKIRRLKAQLRAASLV